MSNTTNQDNAWHLDKRVQVSHILATITAAVSVVMYMATIRQDIELLKVQYTATVNVQHERDDRQDKASAETVAQLRSQLERMEAKLDRLVEWRYKQQGGSQ